MFPETLSTFAVALKKEFIKGLYMTDYAGTIFEMPDKVNYGALGPDPPFTLPGPIIGFSIKESAIAEEGILQVEVITNQCNCPQTQFVYDATVPTDITVVYPTQATSLNPLPSHTHTMGR